MIKNFFEILFIYLVALGQLWLAGSLVAARWLLSCGMQTLSCGMHVGSSSLTRDWTRAPCIGSSESQPLHHLGSPYDEIFKPLFTIIKNIYDTWILLETTHFPSLPLINVFNAETSYDNMISVKCFPIRYFTIKIKWHFLECTGIVRVVGSKWADFCHLSDIRDDKRLKLASPVPATSPIQPLK